MILKKSNSILYGEIEEIAKKKKLRVIRFYAFCISYIIFLISALYIAINSFLYEWVHEEMTRMMITKYILFNYPIPLLIAGCSLLALVILVDKK